MTVLELGFEINRIREAINKIEIVLLREPNNEEYKEKKKILEEEYKRVVEALVEKLPHLENDENLRLR